MPATSLSASRISFGQNARIFNVGGIEYLLSTLPFNMQPQQQSNWCWAATSTSVSHFYLPSSAWTQCLVANGEMSRHDCCSAPVPQPCNQPWFLDKALTRTGNFQAMVGGPIGYAAISAEIAAGRVVGVRIGWRGGGGHFVAIYGCSTVGGIEYVDVDDPIFAKSHITLAAFTSNYQGSGTWTHTYYTKRAVGLKFKLPVIDPAVLAQIASQRLLLTLGQSGAVANMSVSASGGSDASSASVALPHHVYVMGLDDVEAGRVAPDKPAALRVFEVANDRKQAVFELSAPVQSVSQLLSMSEDPATLARSQQALTEAEKIAEAGESEPELTLLRVPALYVEAYWLRYPDTTKDMIVPIRHGVSSPSPQPISAKSFFDQLAEEAKERRKGSTDPAIAP